MLLSPNGAIHLGPKGPSFLASADKIERLDFASAKADMKPFVTNSAQIADWLVDLFRHLLMQTKTIE